MTTRSNILLRITLIFFLTIINTTEAETETDSDYDGVADHFENKFGFDPLNFESVPQISLEESLTIVGSNSDGRLGYSVSHAGDVDNDGVDDVIIGVPFGRNADGETYGHAKVVSGKTSEVLYILSNSSASINGDFGWSVSDAGDVNNDNYADLIVGAPNGNNSLGINSGYVVVYSGLDGQILYRLDGTIDNEDFGLSVSGAGDVNNDGYDDVIIGQPYSDMNGEISGAIKIISGMDGATLHSIGGTLAYERFGYSVSNIGDLNNDDYDDVIVGAHTGYNAQGAQTGYAKVISGKDGDILFSVYGDSNSNFGQSVSGAGDVNNDGTADFIVGEPYGDEYRGLVHVFSGIDGSSIYTLSGDEKDDYFGYSVSSAGDTNNDGYDDLIIGAPYSDQNGSYSGSAKLISGSDGEVLQIFLGDSAAGMFGYSVSGAGKVSSDGYFDIIIGAYRNSRGKGSAYLFISTVDTDNDSISDDIDSDDDNDGLTDERESELGSNDKVTDTDGDKLTDSQEALTYLTSPIKADTDNDTLSDFNEIYLYETNPNSPDSDSDGLSDGEEIYIYLTNALIADTDADGLTDGLEVKTYSTNPKLLDSDDDGLSDGEEINIYLTNVLVADTDEDGLADGLEVKAYSTNPNLLDSDGDGLSDGEEINIYLTDVLVADTDEDGLTDGLEVKTYSTNPKLLDSDGDELSDGDEVNVYVTNPMERDTDADGVEDGIEVSLNSDPNKAQDIGNCEKDNCKGSGGSLSFLMLLLLILIVINGGCGLDRIQGVRVKLPQ
jgi:hypothetical protein